jgi:YidC/Oxa1 family membrane protein insertase
LPEVLNPNLQNQRGDGFNRQAILAVTMLGLVILCAHLYFSRSKPGTPTQATQAQLHKEEPSVARGSTVGERTGRASSERQTISGRALPHVTTPMGKTTLVEAPNQFGWLTVIAKPLYLALRLLYEHGIGNWGWAIIILTVTFNLLMIWPRMMSTKSSLTTMRLQPKVEAIKKRYADLKMSDPKRAAMNTELMALYKDEGANIYGGCLPLLLQMPLFFAYFRVLQNAAELHRARWFWITDLSSPDPLHILPILIVVTMSITQFITPSQGMDPTQRRLLAFVMPAVMGFTLWHYASGLALYWATGNLINLAMQLGINRTRMGKEMHALAAKRA